MTDHGCWKSEYDWQVSRRFDSPSNQTILSVLFDNGAQRQFSSVRISLLLGRDTTAEHYAAWGITRCPSSLSIVYHNSAQTIQNDPSLPICHIVFVAERHSARSQSMAVEAARLCGEIVLSVPDSSTPSSSKLFEFDCPLTENTQSVSVSFVSLYLLSTSIPHGVFSDLLLDQPATVGRVVRVISAKERRTITLPTDILILIFESLLSPLAYRGWRRDLLNSALVCREWTCALDTLLIDFRSRDIPRGHPPEIVGFANALVARPSLALDIKHLSAGYLEKHPSWDPSPPLPLGTLSPMFLLKLKLQQNDTRRARFGKAFLSILRATKDVQTLSLDTTNALVVSPSDLSNALHELTKLDTLSGRCTLTIAQLLICIATCPSLRRLTILSVLPANTRGPAPHPSLSCRLTELILVHVPIKDDELACLANASSATLQRLTLNHISNLTNSGLCAALSTVSGSLVYLCVTISALLRGEEEHALDTTIVRMERLAELTIVPHVASERMIVRRAEAFACQWTPVLPKVHLRLVIEHEEVRDGGLLGAVERDWPGWEMDEELRTQ